MSQNIWSEGSSWHGNTGRHLSRPEVVTDPKAPADEAGAFGVSGERADSSP